MDSTLVIPRSTLMHASLAYLSDELKAMDSIITSSSSTLPLELLLLIRAHLLILMTDHLIVRSSSALRRYENSLRYLLCPECREYYEFVFGDDIWDWEFSGACACSSRSISSIALRRRDSRFSTLNPMFSDRPSLNPKKFSNRHHWLEFYLSMKALRLLRRSVCSSGESRIIWNLVSNVLDCYSVRVHRTEQKFGRESVVVIPHQPIDKREEEDSITLERVERELALSVEYDVPLLEASSFPDSAICQRFSSGDRCSVASCDRTLLFLQVSNSLCGILLTAISVPVSFVTLVVTVVCFYSRPCAFRLI